MDIARARASGAVKTRGRRSRRRQRSVLLAGGGALGVALAAILSIASVNGVDVAAAAVTRAQSLVDLMNRRSPGERTEAHLNKTKHKHARVLAEREQPQLPVPDLYTPLVAAFAQPVPVLPVIPEAAPLFAEAAPPLPAIFAPSFGGAIFTPGGTGGGGGGGGGGGPPTQPPTQPPGQPTPPTPAVPEPATWAMMILGFGLTGCMLRRRRPALCRAPNR